MSLGRKIIGNGDFLLVLGGTPTTKAILASRRFRQADEARELFFRHGLDAADAGGFDLHEANGAPLEAPEDDRGRVLRTQGRPHRALSALRAAARSFRDAGALGERQQAARRPS